MLIPLFVRLGFSNAHIFSIFILFHDSTVLLLLWLFHIYPLQFKKGTAIIMERRFFRRERILLETHPLRRRAQADGGMVYGNDAQGESGLHAGAAPSGNDGIPPYGAAF